MAIDEIEIAAEHFGDAPPLGVVHVTVYGMPGAYEVRLLDTATGRSTSAPSAGRPIGCWCRPRSASAAKGRAAP